jgi:hypothetical protein
MRATWSEPETREVKRTDASHYLRQGIAEACGHWGFAVFAPSSMGRTRPKTRKARPPAAELTETQREKKSEPTVEALLEKAQELIVQCDYNLAGKFVERVLQRAPDNVVGKEILGVVQLETGSLDAAKQVRFASYMNPRSVFPTPVFMLDVLIVAAATSGRTIPTPACCASISRPAER